MERERTPHVVRRLGAGPAALLPLAPSLADLAAGTEFRAYGEPQWRFLLGGGDVTGFAIEAPAIVGDGEGGAARRRLDGCVLRVRVDDGTVGFGMVLVRPSMRGRGLARALLREAMMSPEEGGGGAPRSVLAVCSPLGQPLYRRLGFRDAGAVTALTCAAADVLRLPRDPRVAALDGRDCAGARLSALVERDARAAAGAPRRERLELLLRGSHGEGARAAVAFASADGGRDAADAAIGVARRAGDAGPLIVGPAMGREECFVPLVRALVEEHCGRGEGREGAGALGVTMMIAGHPSLVKELLDIEGMTRLWECPAMSSDGRPIYPNGDGSYLALMHPTLG